jgi:TusA-related sulfurtransferase
MTSTFPLQQAVRNFLAQVPSGERIETLALATTLLVQLDDPAAIEDTRSIVRREATALAWNVGTRNSDHAVAQWTRRRA